MLNSKQRARLRSMANNYETLFQVGKSGLTENVYNQIDEALEARELIKIRVLETSMLSAKEAAIDIAENCSCDIVGAIGSKVILYRPSKTNKRIEL